MSKCDYAGIDYGRGMSNIDHETGIRYGVIHHREVGEAWYEESEANYGDPECPGCGGKCIEYDEDKHGDYEDKTGMKVSYGCLDYACEECKASFDIGDVMPEEPYSFSYDKDGYQAEQGYDDFDIFIMKAPYYTYCQYCSPCAPGAGYVMNWIKKPDDPVGIMPPKGYCFGHTWFEGGKAPYPVYRVSDGSLVEPINGEVTQ